MILLLKPLKVRKFRRRRTAVAMTTLMIPLPKPLKVRKQPKKRVAVMTIQTQAQIKRPKKIVLIVAAILLPVVMMRRRKSLQPLRLQLPLKLLSQMPTLERQNCSSKDYPMTQMT